MTSPSSAVRYHAGTLIHRGTGQLDQQVIIATAPGPAGSLEIIGHVIAFTIPAPHPDRRRDLQQQTRYARRQRYLQRLAESWNQAGGPFDQEGA